MTTLWESFGQDFLCEHTFTFLKCCIIVLLYLNENHNIFINLYAFVLATAVALCVFSVHPILVIISCIAETTFFKPNWFEG